MNEDNIRDMIRQISGVKVDDGRRISIFRENSYDDTSGKYEVWFFYIEGTPPRAVGFVRKFFGGWTMRVDAGTKAMLYFFKSDFQKTTRSQLAPRF